MGTFLNIIETANRFGDRQPALALGMIMLASAFLAIPLARVFR